MSGGQNDLPSDMVSGGRNDLTLTAASIPGWSAVVSGGQNDLPSDVVSGGRNDLPSDVVSGGRNDLPSDVVSGNRSVRRASVRLRMGPLKLANGCLKGLFLLPHQTRMLSRRRSLQVWRLLAPSHSSQETNKTTNGYLF